jgi:hypothetical protein
MTRKAHPGDRVAQDLYGVPLQDFVRARNALAARLRDEGRPSEAAEVQRLRKSTPAIWAINQLARREPEEVGQLIKSAEHLKRAHFGRAGDVAEATERHRAALQNLIARAKAILTTAGLKTSPDVLRRISTTLSGAAADPQARSDLEGGRLTEERQALGFEALTGTPAPPPRRPAERKPGQRAEPLNRSTLAALRGALRAAQAQLREQRERARDLERVAAKRQHAAEQAATAADKMRQQLSELDRRAREENSAAEQASQAAGQAQQEAQRAAERARAAEQALERAKTAAH